MYKDIGCLYDEYLDTRKALQAFTNKLKARRKSLPKRYAQNFAESELDDLLAIQISLGNSMIADVEYALEVMEDYKPIGQRPFREKKIRELNLHRQDKRANEGVNPDGEVLFGYQTEDFTESIGERAELVSMEHLAHNLTQRQIDIVLGLHCYEVKSIDLAKFFNITRQGVEKSLKLGLNNMADNLKKIDDYIICLEPNTPDEWISSDLFEYLEKNFKRKKDFL